MEKFFYFDFDFCLFFCDCAIDCNDFWFFAYMFPKKKIKNYYNQWHIHKKINKNQNKNKNFFPIYVPKEKNQQNCVNCGCAHKNKDKFFSVGQNFFNGKKS